MQPDVSFIIAAYNAEATLARAIDSALAQRGVTVEVIVADDVSSDRTAAIAASYADRGVKLVRLPANAGPGGARNAALSVAGGRWLAVLDADDTVNPERMARLIERAEEANAEIVVDNLEVVDDAAGATTTMFDEARLQAVREICLADYARSNMVFRSTFNYGYMKPVFERAFIERHAIRYDESLRIGEDFIFLASALAAGARCVVEPASGYVYHVRAGSISRVLRPHHVEAMMAGDAAFLRRFRLDKQARAAFAERRRSLREAAAFLALVQHLKAGQPLRALAAAARRPAALIHLRMPIGARLRRLGFTPPAIRHG
ncbi:glycosyltransferase family 2 protein [Mesorhizobium xinjiangense]|uniref:glycosyltransferase family 2 protein n=1 Tax=Mesorhizobium xinjiangense TaxID=2678685 RepID=UPI0012ED6ECF|nr:glycosyltransferase family 2 protein [Mesorhizobium xinjiangense]